ncbi:insulinase family protein [Candidatus Moduliflexota bacterium]
MRTTFKTNLRRCAAALIALVLLLPAGTASAALEELEERVVEETLANGMRVIVLPRRQSPTVSLSMRFLVGSVEEEGGRTGLAHLLEHMLFKGTTTLGTRNWAMERPLRDRIEELAAALDGERGKGEGASGERVAALKEELRRTREEARRFVVKDEIDAIYTAQGAQGFNASTGADLTTYTVSLPSNRVELWARIESERLRDPVMREFYSERDVVVEERLQSFDTDPSRRLSALLFSTAFRAHPYRRPVIGWRGDVEDLRSGDALRFFRTWYTPGNAVLAAVGDVDPASFIALLKKYFEPLPAQRADRRPISTEPEQRGERRALLHMDAQPEVMLAFHKPTLPHEDDYAFDLIDGLLAGGRTSRLYRRLVEEEGTAISVSTSNGSPGARFPNLFVIRAVPRFPHSAAEVEEGILAELDRLAREDVSPGELARVRNGLRASMIRGLQSNKGLAGTLSYFQSVAGDWRYVTTHLEVLGQITPAKVREAAARYLTAGNRTVVTLVTDRPEEGK